MSEARAELPALIVSSEQLSWQERALCAQTDPEAFFPEKGGSTREAKRVCLSYDVASTISEIPASRALIIWCSVNGTPPTGNIGFGELFVNGCNRVPLPPTNKIADVFIY